MEEEFNKILLKTFEDAAEKIKKLEQRPSDQDLLELYGLYKQSIIGNCNTSKPSFFYVKDRKKWNAWNNLHGKSKNDSMNLYIEKVDTLCKTN